MKKVRLGDVCDVFAGQGAPQGNEKYCNYDSGIPFIKAGDLGDLMSGKSERELQCVDEAVAKECKLKLYQAGSVLFAKSGMSCMKGYVYCTKEPCYVVSHLAIITPKKVEKEYLKHYFQYYKPNTLVKDSAYPSISLSDISNMEILLPSIEEQKEIAGRLDKVVALIEKRKEQLAKLDQLVKSRFIEMFGDVTVEQKNTIKLGSICKTMGGGTPTTKKSEYYEGNIPWISTVSLGPNYIDGSDAKGYITNDAIINSATKLIPAYSVMVGTRVGVGKSSVNTVPICANQDINSITGLDSQKYMPLFIKYVVDAYQSYFDSIKKGATILGINSNDLKNINVPKVSIGLQKEFVSFAEQVDKSKFDIQQSIDKLETLKKSLMQQYFG